jgi:hypothetical protein
MFLFEVAREFAPDHSFGLMHGSVRAESSEASVLCFTEHGQRNRLAGGFVFGIHISPHWQVTCIRSVWFVNNQLPS